MIFKMRRNFRERIHSCYQQLLQFKTFHDNKTIKSSTSSLNEISVKIQFQNQISFERSKSEARQFNSKKSKCFFKSR